MNSGNGCPDCKGEHDIPPKSKMCVTGDNNLTQFMQSASLGNAESLKECALSQDFHLKAYHSYGKNKNRGEHAP